MRVRSVSNILVCRVRLVVVVPEAEVVALIWIRDGEPAAEAIRKVIEAVQGIIRSIRHGRRPTSGAGYLHQPGHFCIQRGLFVCGRVTFCKQRAFQKAC